MRRSFSCSVGRSASEFGLEVHVLEGDRHAEVVRAHRGAFDLLALELAPDLGGGRGPVERLRLDQLPGGLADVLDLVAAREGEEEVEGLRVGDLAPGRRVPPERLAGGAGEAHGVRAGRAGGGGDLLEHRVADPDHRAVDAAAHLVAEVRVGDGDREREGVRHAEARPEVVHLPARGRPGVAEGDGLLGEHRHVPHHGHEVAVVDVEGAPRVAPEHGIVVLRPLVAPARTDRALRGLEDRVVQARSVADVGDLDRDAVEDVGLVRMHPVDQDALVHPGHHPVLLALLVGVAQVGGRRGGGRSGEEDGGDRGRGLRPLEPC